MGINSAIFFIFLAIVLIIYYILPKKLQWIVLLIASLFFFAYTSGILTLYMVLEAGLVYVGGLCIQSLSDRFKQKKKELEKAERKILKARIKKQQKAIVTAVVLASIVLLGGLKYCNFIGDIVNSVAGLMGNDSLMPVIKIALPIGISYYTLMAISYVVDVFRGVVEAERNPFKLLLFVCYFPHITEGPFDTYSSLSKQFNEEHSFDYDRFINALALLLLGLVKKMVLADRIAYISNEIFDNYTEYSGIAIIIGMAMYMLCIYFDFSGCIDAVRGVSAMFGVEIASNFDRPFFSHSVQEFWRRWHITLGAWLKNYIFYPVSLSPLSKKMKFKAKSEAGRYFAATIPTLLPLLCVWLAMGIWHGASWKYVVYGLYYFVIIVLGLLFEPLFIKLFNNRDIKRDKKALGVLQVVRTNILIMLGLAMFRADTLTQFWQMLCSIPSLCSNVANVGVKCLDLAVLDYVLIGVMSFALLFKDYLETKGKDIDGNILSNPKKRWLWVTFAIAMLIILGVYGSGYTEQTSVYAEF